MSNFQQRHNRETMKLFLVAILAVLALTAILFTFVGAPTTNAAAIAATPTAQTVVARRGTNTNTVYLPLVIKQSSLPPSSPYAQMLARVQQVCSATGLNQVCYANGQITLESKTGTILFNQPGAIADLVNVQRLSLVSTGSDPQKWSLAWLRLTADSGTPNQELMILAFGNVEISNILPFTGQRPLDETVLPSLQFASQPVTGVTKAGSSGLIVANSTEDGVLSLTLNGGVVTLASTALVEAQPGSQMSVTMANGVSNTEANGQSSIAVQGHRVTVPLNQTGKVSGPPTQPWVIDPLHYVLGNGDLLIPLDGPAWQRLAGSILYRLNRSIDRCIGGKSAYVYNVLFWTRVIEGDRDIKEHVDPAQLAQAYGRAPRCLTFEVDFDSSANEQKAPITASSHVHTQGLRMQFSPTGNFLSGDIQTLVYLSFQYQAPVAPCTVSTSTTNGQLETVGGRLRVAGNGVRISSDILVAQWPYDEVTIYCPPPPPSVIPMRNWEWVFFYLHQDLRDPALPSYKFRDWRYTGGQHFAEAIYDRTETIDGITLDAFTTLIMLHTPQQ